MLIEPNGLCIPLTTAFPEETFKFGALNWLIASNARLSRILTLVILSFQVLNMFLMAMSDANTS
jgi:hypothetical protein